MSSPRGTDRPTVRPRGAARRDGAAFLAVRLRESHGADVQIERTEPFNEFVALDEGIREAASAYANRETKSTPYVAYAAGTDHPDPDAMRGENL